MTTILVVDDEFLVADVLMYALEDEGYVVLRASDGRKALAHIARQPVALVITDYMMPTMNGLELAEAIHDTADAVSPPPIILMSGAQAHIARRQPDLFAAVFDKPFRVADLVARVKDIVGPAH